MGGRACHGAGPDDGDVAGSGKGFVGAVEVLEDAKGKGEAWVVSELCSLEWRNGQLGASPTPDEGFYNEAGGQKEPGILSAVDGGESGKLMAGVVTCRLLGPGLPRAELNCRRVHADFCLSMRCLAT